MSNTVCHIEFVTSEFKEAGELFSKLFGWKTSPSGDNYVVWQGDDPLGGGFSSEFGPQQGPGTLVYIKVEDIEATLQDVTDNGGAVVQPKTKISDEHGNFALFSDPCGTVVGLWSRT